MIQERLALTHVQLIILLIHNLSFLTTSLVFQFVAGSLPLIFLINRVKFNISFTYYLLFSVIATIVLSITSFYQINNLSIINTYLFLSFLSLIAYYNSLKIKYLNWINLLFLIVFVSLFFFEIFHSGFAQKSINVMSLFSIIWSQYFLVYSLKTKNHIDFKTTHEFISFSILFYNCSSFLFYFKIIDLAKHDLWFIHNYIEGISKLIIAYSFWKLPKI